MSSQDKSTVEDDDNINLCPICKRSFNTLPGLRQHVTKKHSTDEINTIIANKTQQIISQSTSTGDSSSRTSKLQIAIENVNSSSETNYHQFDIEENASIGDCLFTSVLGFLTANKTQINSIVPEDILGLRLMAVNYIQSNFVRFQEDLAINLQGEIPIFASKSTSVENLSAHYVGYMSSPGKYGTTSELCAMAEIFNFGFCVIRRNDSTNYACYDYGSMEKVVNQHSNLIVHLLFSGNVGGGHFRLLASNEGLPGPVIPSGKYKLLENFTSARVTTIAPIHFSGLINDPIEEPTDTDNTGTDNTNTPDVSFEDFVILLARCKSKIRVLKRVPRGARIMAANKLSKCVDECLANPNLSKNWKNLLTFSYTCLRVPDKVNNVSLSTMVKRNIEKAQLIFNKQTNKRKPISLSKRVEYKIADGDIRGAVRILSSTDTLAPQNESTFAQLKMKHPPPSREMLFPDPPDKNFEPLVVSEKDIFYSIKSFPNQASLCALDKKGGGVRPIAVGNTFRRITSKLSSASVRSEMSSNFAPRQVGYGIKGGCEAAAHATRTFIKKNAHRKVVIVKIDFQNAFNEVDRDIFLNEMRNKCPAIFPYLWQCYSSPSLLFYDDFVIWSENGAQQGDPCGPLLFSSAIQFVIDALVSEFVIFYLDDGTIGGDYESVLRDFKTVIEECAKIGLQINPTKCELFFCSQMDRDITNRFEQLSPGICIVNEFTLLGTSITNNAFAGVYNKKLAELKLLFERLQELDNYHIAFYILKNCFAIPKLVFLLRTTPTFDHMDIVDEIDSQIKLTLEKLTNSSLQSTTWTLASLPINIGGIGVRRVRDIALPAFLSSVNAVCPLVSTMLNLPTLNIEEIADYVDSLNVWNRSHPDQIQPENPTLQNQWNSIVTDQLLSSIQFERDDDKARFLALQRPESGAWLHALPSKSMGTLLDNNSFRIIVGLRLGMDICLPHVCICGSQVDKKGHHGSKCKKSVGRHARHAELNLIITRALALVDIPSVLEPTGLVRNDGKRVDGMTSVPWSNGSHLIWDATCTDTFAPSNIKFSTRQAGRAAEDKAQRKRKKYESLINQNHIFIPFAVETMGPWSHEAIGFFNELSKMLNLKTNEPRSKSYLKQRISMAIQRGNAAAVIGTFRSCEKMDEIFYLL